MSTSYQESGGRLAASRSWSIWSVISACARRKTRQAARCCSEIYSLFIAMSITQTEHATHERTVRIFPPEWSRWNKYDILMGTTKTPIAYIEEECLNISGVVTPLWKHYTPGSA